MNLFENLLSIVGLAFVLAFLGLIIMFAAAGRNRPGRTFREIPAYTRLRKVVGLAVEAGTRLHVSLGWGSMTEPQSAVGLVGLSMLARIARAATISDRPPMASSGDATLSILGRDTMQATYRSLGIEDQYDPTSSRLLGVTPFSYAAGTIPVLRDDQVATTVLVGHFGSEVALINDAAAAAGSLTVAGTDNVPAQAVLYATAQEPLIGEEVFAGAAYLGAGTFHEASLRAQDVLRWLVVGLVLIGSVLSLFGLDQVLQNLLAGLGQ